MSIEDFKNLFKRKSEESMQDRAEKSRRQQEELEQQFDQTSHNLEGLIEELTKKKQNG